MNNFNKDQDQFELLRKIQKKPQSSQRELANELGFSLGKLNYCLKALKKKDSLNSKIFKIVKIRLGIFSTLSHPKALQKEQNSQLIL